MKSTDLRRLLETGSQRFEMMAQMTNEANVKSVRGIVFVRGLKHDRAEAPAENNVLQVGGRAYIVRGHRLFIILRWQTCCFSPA